MKKIILQTSSFSLRPINNNDYGDFSGLQTDRDVTLFLGGPRNTEQVDERFRYFIEHQLTYGYSLWAVESAFDVRFIGCAGIFHLGMDNLNDELELAYALQPVYWGKGLGTC